MATVGVKFCGGCNPSIDRTMIFREIRDLAGGVTFTGLADKGLDALLLICGCSIVCPVEQLGLRSRPRLVVVAGQTVNGRDVPEGFIAQVVAEKLVNLTRSHS
ncbi:MAG: hypothetical protein HYX94_09800 [Chloroflexi bacterium]|nr:hypothetical protein [Chloroflexota bacterium]